MGIPPLNPYPNGVVTQIFEEKKAEVSNMSWAPVGIMLEIDSAPADLFSAPPRHTHTLLSCQQPQFSLAQNLSRDLSRLQQSSTPKLSPTSSPLSIKGSASVVHLRMEATPVLTFNSDLLRICMDLFIWQNLSPEKGSESDDGVRSLKQGRSVPSVRLWDFHQQPQHLNLSEGKTESWNRKNKKEASPT